MNVHTDIEHLPAFKNAVVTIGTFDGVHLGHRQIIAQLKAEAEKNSGETVIITFHPHPRKIVHVSRDVRLITTINERIELLSGAGIDHLVIVPFTQEFSELTPREYVETFLKKRFNPSVIIIGYDHKFGKEREGDYRLLEEYSAKRYFELKEIPQHVINLNTVSSTRIRDHISNGEIEQANALLGYNFSFDAVVVKGDRRGRSIGYPTANLEMTDNEKIVPGNGVYAVKVSLPDIPSQFKGMMNIGIRPTVDGKTRTIEVHIFDFAGEIYGETIRVHVRSFLRKEQKFPGIAELKSQLDKDKIAAQSIA